MLTTRVTPNPGPSSSTRSTGRLCVFPRTSCRPRGEWANAPWSGRLALGSPLPIARDSPVAKLLRSCQDRPATHAGWPRLLRLQLQCGENWSPANSFLPACLFHRASGCRPRCPAGTGLGAIAPVLAPGLWEQQGLGRAGKQQRSGCPPHSPARPVLPSAPGPGALKARGVILNKEVGMRHMFRCTTAQIRYM